MELKELKEQFLLQYIMSSDNTKLKYSIELDLFFNICGIYTYDNLKSFNGQNLTLFYNYSKEKKWNPNTINQRLATAKLFTKWCVKKGFIKSDFLEEIKKIRTVNETRFTPSNEECVQLLKYIREHTSKKRLYVMTRLLLNSGLRRMEICNLKLNDLDKENSTLKVYGKGKKIVEQPIPPAVMSDIIDYINTERIETMNKYTELGGKDLGYVFVSNIGDSIKIKNKNLENGNKINEISFYNQIKTHAKNSGMENGDKFDVHSLRRAIGTQIYEETGDIMTAKEFLRHTNVTTTEKCYINYDKKKVSKSINEVFEKNNKVENNDEYELFLTLQKKYGNI